MEDDIEKRKNKLKELLLGWVKDNYDKVFLAVLISAFLIRFWVFLQTQNQPLWWDEATYLATAKRWGLGLNITDVWYYRRAFFWPALCALPYLLGLGETGVRFLQVIFSTGIVAVSYFLIRDMFDKKLALLSTIGLTFSWVILFFTGRVLSDIPFSFFLLLSLFFFYKGYFLNQGKKFIYLFSIFFGIAVLTRFQGVMFIFPILITIFIKEKFAMFKNKSLWTASIIFLVMLIPHFINYSLHFGFFLNDIFYYYFGVGATSATSAAASNGLSTIFNYFKDLPYGLSIPVFVLFLIGVFYFFINMFLGIDKLFKDEKIQKSFFVFIWITIPLLILGYIAAIVEQRYSIAILPFLFMMVSTALLKIGEKITQVLKLKKTIVFILLILIFAGFMIPNVLWANNLIESKKTSYIEIQQAGLWVKENSNKNDIIIGSSFPQISYYSERSITTGTEKGNPEDHKPLSREEFEEFIKTERPRYWIVYAFQPADWAISYLQEHKEWVPVRAYYIEQNPVLIIYELNMTKT